ARGQEISSNGCCAVSCGVDRFAVAKKHHHKHGQIKKDYRPASYLRNAAGRVIPAPDASPPTEKNCPDDSTPRFRDEPEREAVEEPALREKRRKQQKPGIAMAPAIEGQQ